MNEQMINPHVISQAASIHSVGEQHRKDGKARNKNSSALGAKNSVSKSPKNHKKVGDSPPMSADDAVNAAINLQVDMIIDLSDVTISMSDMNATIQRTAVSNAQSQVEMLRALLSAQGACCNKDMFNQIVKGWSKSSFPDTAQGFADFLQSLDKASGTHYYSTIFSGVMNNPSINQSEKDAFAQQFKQFYSSCNGHLSSFLNKSSVISQQLSQASTYVSNWQSIADSMKPTQIQQATTELIAEIGSEASMWGDVISA